jgi:ribosomal protein S18 acetylase RimI-like enzyme
MGEVTLRPLRADDHAPIIRVLDAWWGGRPMRDMLPRLFFEHFNTTSFIAERDGEIAGFLVGFFSPAHADEAYIHFVGVHPHHRGEGVGRMLYDRFFALMRGHGRAVVRCVTSPVNAGSIGFHTRMGFAPKPSETNNADGVPYAADYDGPGEGRVLFSKHISP